jgi:integrase
MPRIKLTAPRVAAFECPPGREQAFLWDADAPGLAMRVTARGAKAYVLQSRFANKPLRVTIGAPDAWSIAKARERARELQTMIDSGRDPREVIGETIAADAAKRAADRRRLATVAEAWRAYLEDRRPHWGARHYADHVDMTRDGGRETAIGTRGRGVTIDGPLRPLMALRLRELDAPTVEAWAKREAKARPARARLALRILKAFMRWCSSQPEYAGAVAPEAATSKRARETLGKPATKADVLLREQLPAWFKAVQAIASPTHRAYLQALLLVGCRPGEMLDLEWKDIDEQWRSLRIRDKVDGERLIPLTPYVQSLLLALPRRNRWVFSSPLAEGGRIQRPNVMHARACTVAGVPDLTLHGLRRSFRTLTEWLEVPAGVVAQLQGHKPSATAEKHYTRRPLDLLRIYSERIELAMLEWAGVPFEAKDAGLKLVRA